VSTTDGLAQRAQVKGTLSKEVIRRVINRNINAVRLCLEPVLEHNGIANVHVQFTIGPKGDVQEATVLSSKTNDAKADACVLEAFKKMTFPPPEGGGIVTVTYPVIGCGTGG
jgi:TonB family protein